MSVAPAPLSTSAGLATTPARLLSLDAFRGLTVAGMILVNNPGSWDAIYPPLEHAVWNGWTPTDLIFPFFLFIVGVSITFALGTEKARNDRTATRKILRRGAVLFGLGLFLNLFPSFNFATVRIPGVLQRIALVYILASLIFLRTTSRQQHVLVVVLLLGYWVLMTLVPVPGVGYANLDPETNLGAWLDRSILTPAHLWKTAKVWDPEGILGTMPALATGLLGILTGTALRRTDRPVHERLSGLFVAGLGLTVAGLVWDGWFPINKALWTSSYVLLAAGLAMLGLAASYWLIDRPDAPVAARRVAMPLVAFGVNAITVFFLSGLIPRMLNLIKIVRPDGTKIGSQNWLYQHGIAPFFSDPRNASLAGALTFVLIWFGILWLMYKRGVIIKV
jgi:predicted acyltransferase